MSSLSYGNWIPSDKEKSRKRTPTYDKPPKLANNNFNDRLMDVNDLELNLKSTSTNLNEYANSTEKKQSEIHDLLDQMNQENFENETPNIQPIDPPELVSKTNTGGLQNIMPLSGMPEGEALSNYQTIYNKGTTYRPEQSHIPAYPFVQTGTPDSSHVLLEKLNYMIYLLEQQQHEKTDYILEEFLLYSFLGIFMIYIVDAFARSGNNQLRYTR